jgi:hypothetical protein
LAKELLLNYSFDERKSQLPSKRIGLGLLVALAIRGLPHRALDRTLTSQADSAARFMP